MNVKSKHITKLTFLLTITAFAIDFPLASVFTK